MNAELICMVDNFPDLREMILSLYERNEEFQTLCFDYFLCLRSLDQWEINRQKDEKFIQEYKELRRTLESELLQIIEKQEKFLK
jgi:hypothetical protein